MFDWTPCRFNTLGWKYQERGSYQKHLNQSYKINSVGGYGPNQDIDQLKNSLMPDKSNIKDYGKLNELMA